VDTRSTDSTQTIVSRYLSQGRLPGGAVEKPRRDSAYNRSFALAGLPEHADRDYAVVTDADDTLAHLDGLDTLKFKENLDKDFARTGPAITGSACKQSTKYWQTGKFPRARHSDYATTLDLRREAGEHNRRTSTGCRDRLTTAGTTLERRAASHR
jgi:hypothetical protein